MLSGPSRRAFSLIAAAALLIGLALAWALPALAHPGHARERAGAGTSAQHRRRAAVAATGSAQVAAHISTTVPLGPGPVISPAALAGPGSWSRPFTLMGPENSDLIPSILTVSQLGSVAVGSGTTNVDATNLARADLIIGSATDRIARPVTLSGAQQALAVAYLGRRLVLLTGTSPAADSCCSTVSARSSTSGTAFGAGHTIVDDLQGPTDAALVPVRGGLLAVTDNQAGVSVARANGSAGFGASASLAGDDPTPPLMAAAPLADGGAAVAWTAPVTHAQTVTGTVTGPNGVSTTSSGYDQPANQLIEFATSGPGGLPHGAHLAISVAAGHQIDALAMAQHDSGATIAWIESWSSGSQFRSQLFWADLRTGAVASALSPASTAATGLSMSSSARGRQVLSWQACDVSAGTCTAEAALRPHGDAWGPVRSLGPVDPDSFPVASQSSLGQSLVGWIDDGLVRAAVARPGGSGFSRPVRVATVGNDADLSLGFGAGRRALAAWTQGTIDEKIVAARFTP